MNTGWIKLHRQLRESPYYKSGTALQVWLACLFRASTSEREVFLKRQRIKLKPGQFVMGREEFGHGLGISGSTVWYWILQLKADSMIDIKKNSKGSIVTVKNWSHYQGSDSTSDNRKTADEQQMNTIKNVKNVKNYNYLDVEKIKWLKKFDEVRNPEAWWRKCLKACGREAAEKSWREAKRGAGIGTPGEFYRRCLHWRDRLPLSTRGRSRPAKPPPAPPGDRARA